MWPQSLGECVKNIHDHIGQIIALTRLNEAKKQRIQETRYLQPEF